MSGGASCYCTPRDRKAWQVTARNVSRSAFNGYREAWSRYSEIRCTKCKSFWRTTAKYVKDLPDAPADWFRHG